MSVFVERLRASCFADVSFGVLAKSAGYSFSRRSGKRGNVRYLLEVSKQASQDETRSEVYRVFYFVSNMKNIISSLAKSSES